MTKLMSWFTDTVSFISGAMIRIFGATDDEYPATGIQPYSGDPSNEH
ncbi:MAG: isochorismate synthase [Alkalinema sp. RL_2_19]|nr:isochorismate synthase [Alkalinema sp. RL_2_19]